ncbi:hypothetical protein [Phormidium sp. CCY1219]|nr:hypothetical protein [Phormidium sp. CCY1219]
MNQPLSQRRSPVSCRAFPDGEKTAGDRDRLSPRAIAPPTLKNG